MRSRPENWLYPTERGLYCEPGQFHIDPHLTVDRAVITHGHGDHARSGHGSVLATAETVEIMKVRYGADCAQSFATANGGQMINGVSVRLVLAGHILGSAQIVLDWQGTRVVVSGDYKRKADPTCAARKAPHNESVAIIVQLDVVERGPHRRCAKRVYKDCGLVAGV